MMIKKQNKIKIISFPHKGIFLTLFFTVFITVTGVGIVVPLLPVYAYKLGATGFYVGMIFGAFSFSRTIFLPFFGRLSDKTGRKPYIIAGLCGYSFVAAAFIFFPSINSLIIIRFFQGIASAMIMPVVQAYIGEITPPQKEGWTMGLFNMSMFASLSLGPFLGGIINDIWSMNTSFAFMGISAVLGLILSIIFLPPVSKEFIQTDNRNPVSWISIIKDRTLLALFVFRFGYIACIGIIWCFLPLFVDIQFSLSSTSTGVLLMIGILISGIFHLPMGYVADQFNKKIMILIGGLLCIAGMFMLTFAKSYYELILAVSVFGLGGGISMPAIMALAVIKGNEKGAMASVMSIITLAHSSGMMIGSIVAGLAMDSFELKFAFPCGIIIMIFTTIIFLFLKKNQDI